MICNKSLLIWKILIQLRRADLLDVDTFQYDRKSHSLIPPPFSSEESLSERYKFPQILIFTGKLKFYHWQQWWTAVFLGSNRLTSFIFQKMSAKWSSLNNHISVSLFKMAFHAEWLVQLAIQLCKWFSWRHLSLCRILKRCWNLIIFFFFTASARTFLSGNGCFSLIVQSREKYSDYCLKAPVLSTVALRYQWKCQHRGKGNCCVSVIMKMMLRASLGQWNIPCKFPVER